MIRVEFGDRDDARLLAQALRIVARGSWWTPAERRRATALARQISEGVKAATPNTTPTPPISKGLITP